MMMRDDECHMKDSPPYPGSSILFSNVELRETSGHP
jgi:hypothetical protein